MVSNGIFVDLILYSQSIIGFILLGYLIYLVRTTKLTYIDAFRQKLVTALYLFSGAIAVFFIVRYYLGITADYHSTILSVVSFFGLIFVSITMLGIFKLKDYISSIIEIKDKNFLKYSILLGIPLSLGLNLIKIYYNPALLSSLISIIFYVIILPLLMGVFYISAFYNFFLHREIRTININLLIYFGFGFLSIAFISIAGIFWDIRYDIVYWVIINFCLVGLIAFFIFGYVDFKNRIKNLEF